MYCECCGESMQWRCTNKETNIAKYKCPNCGLVKEALDDSKPMPVEIRQPKYYYLYNDKYVVHKIIDGIHRYFGIYEDEETAKQVVDRLKACNWNKEELVTVCES